MVAFRGAVFIFFCVFNSAQARAESAGSFEFGMEYLPQTAAGSLNPFGLYGHFRVQSRSSWVKPTFGTTLSFNFGTGRLIQGFVHPGLTLSAANVNYVRPFLVVDGLLGWANYTLTTTSYNGLLYGFLIGGGVEIRFSTKETATALRLSTGYRFVLGSVGGGITGTELTCVQVAAGLTL
jgi:hypothetical protein